MTRTVDVDAARSAVSAAASPGLALPSEVAEYTRTTEGALAQDRYLGRGIPYVKNGRKVLYKWADVHSYVDANTINPGAA